MTLEEALPQVLKKAKYQNGVKKGLREVVKYLDKRAAHMCILAKDCDEPQYSRLVEALCTLHSIPLLKVKSILKSQLNPFRVDIEARSLQSGIYLRFSAKSVGQEAVDC